MSDLFAGYIVFRIVEWVIIKLYYIVINER
jgi:hypothetical protein